MRRWPFAVTVLFLLASRHAVGQTKAECLAAFDKAQELRTQVKLRASRDEFRSCAREACSPPVRKDCSERLEEVSRDIPTLVLGAKLRSGADALDAAYFVDGEPIKQDPGAPLEVDPGPHRVRVERRAPSRAATATEEVIVVRAGERNRLVLLTIPEEASSPPPPAPVVNEEPPKPRPSSAWMIPSAVAVLALGTFGTFAVLGTTKRSSLEASCAPGCSARDVDVLKTRLITADVSLGVALVSAGIAAWLFFHREAAASAHAGARPYFFWPFGQSDSPSADPHFFARSF
jgi:hypothetical protein